MRTTFASIFIGLLLPFGAFAAISSSSASSVSSTASASSSSSSSASSKPIYTRHQAEEACKESTGYTDEQLKIGTFLEIYRKCVNAHMREILKQQVQVEIERERQELINKANETLKARRRGVDPNARKASTSSARRNILMVRKASKRVSTRTLRTKAWEEEQKHAQ